MSKLPSPAINRLYSALLLLFALSLHSASPCACQTPSADEEFTLRTGTLDIRPYGWEDAEGQRHGLVYQMHQAIGQKTGLKFTNKLLPFARMLSMLQSGELDMVTSQPHAAALEAGLPLIVENQINIILGTKNNVEINSIEDLNNKQVLYIIAASYPNIDKHTGNISRVKNYKDMLTMLYHQRADAGVFSEPAYYYWLNTLNYSPERLGKVFQAETRNDWIFVRNNLPDEIRAKISQAVIELQQERYYESLLDALKKGRLE